MSNYDYPDILDIDIEEDEILDHSFDPQQLEKDYQLHDGSEICSVEIEDDRSEMKSEDFDLPPLLQDHQVRKIVPKLDLTKAVNSNSEEMVTSHDKSESSTDRAPFDSVAH